MRISIPSSFLQLLFVLSLFTQILATRKSYIVYLGSHAHGSEPTSIDIDAAKNSHYNLLGSLMGSTEKAKEAIFIQYTSNINGFGAMLEEEEAAEIAKHPDVVSVFLNKENQLYTTKSWDFLGLEKGKMIPEGSIWKKARFGEDTIIANIDTGVWPESKSFSDKGYGPVPSRWKGRCQKDQTENPVHCNRKLIGARYFNKLATDISDSARDQQGHGTHTLSTAAGNFVPGVSVDNENNGTAKGGSPKARVAAYKACGIEGCQDINILAAFDAAISDGVDVISVSLGREQPSTFFEEAVSIGALHAATKGIAVVASAGNGGPSPGTVDNASPWIFTVAASTINRDLSSSKSFVRAPVMASFSSSGPNEFDPALLKPDITAPGVNIIAAFTEDPEAYEGPPAPFKALSGTSMSCPHVAGTVGLLKTLYPHWSPAAIRSAIMTTTTRRDNTRKFIQGSLNNIATPFDYGAGHVQPNLAADPGLVYDLNTDDYLNFICAHGYNESFIRKIYGKPYTCPKSISIADFNYPSIAVPQLQSSITIKRTVKNVGSPGTYKATIEAPNGVSVSVTPTTLVFDAIDQEKSFSVTLKSNSKSGPKDYVFGNLVWSDGKHSVRSPLVVKHK